MKNKTPLVPSENYFILPLFTPPYISKNPIPTLLEHLLEDEFQSNSYSKDEKKIMKKTKHLFIHPKT